MEGPGRRACLLTTYFPEAQELTENIVPKRHCSWALPGSSTTPALGSVTVGHIWQDRSPSISPRQCPGEGLGAWLREGREQKCALRPQLQALHNEMDPQLSG